jgi:hypothetical protein
LFIARWNEAKKIYNEIINRPDFKNKPTLKWIQNYVSFQKSNNKDDEISKILRTLNEYVRKNNNENADPFWIRHGSICSWVYFCRSIEENARF